MSVRHHPLPQLSALAVDDVARAVCRQLGVETGPMHEIATLHTQALVAAAEWNAPDMLTEQFAWERTRLAGIGVTLRYKELHDAVLTALLPHVDRVTHARLRVIYGQAERLDHGRPEEVVTEVSADVTRYLTMALAGDHVGAVAMVRTALAHGAAPGRVIRELLLPAQVETGRLWETGAISVAQEHRVTAITSRCTQLFGLAPVTAPVPRTVVVATVGTEGHDLGLRMLAHVLGNGGWNVDYLGAGVPADDLVEHVLTTRPDVLAVSATMTAHVSAVARVLEGLRDGEATTRVMVGGRVFTARPALATALGADGTATDGESALALCDAWVPAGDDHEETEAPCPVDGGLTDLAERYRIDQRHVDGALALLADESGMSREDLVHRLAGASAESASA